MRSVARRTSSAAAAPPFRLREPVLRGVPVGTQFRLQPRVGVRLDGALDEQLVVPQELRLDLGEEVWQGQDGLVGLMEAIDRVNGRFGKRSVTFGAEGARRSHDTETGQAWAMRRSRKSPAYSTRWEDLVTVYAR